MPDIGLVFGNTNVRLNKYKLSLEDYIFYIGNRHNQIITQIDEKHNYGKNKGNKVNSEGI